MDVSEINQAINLLKVYRMSFVPSAVRGEYVINGLILAKIFTGVDYENIKSQIDETTLQFIDTKLDHLIKLKQELSNEQET